MQHSKKYGAVYTSAEFYDSVHACCRTGVIEPTSSLYEHAAEELRKRLESGEIVTDLEDRAYGLDYVIELETDAELLRQKGK